MNREGSRSVHRTPGAPPVVATSAVPADAGITAWTFDNIHIQGGTIPPTGGTLHVARIKALASTVTNLLFHVTVGGSALTSGQCLAALFNDAGALLGAGAVTGSLHNTGTGGWGDAGFKICPLTVAQAVTPGAWYRVGLYWNGTTGPTLSRAASSTAAAVNLGMTAPLLRYSTADTGLTTTMPLNVGAQTAGPTAWWVGIS